MSGMYRFCKLYTVIVAVCLFSAGIVPVVVIITTVCNDGVSNLLVDDGLLRYIIVSTIIAVSAAIFLVRTIVDNIRLSAKRKEAYRNHVNNTSLQELADEKFRINDFENRLNGCYRQQEDELLKKYK